MTANSKTEQAKSSQTGQERPWAISFLLRRKSPKAVIEHQAGRSDCPVSCWLVRLEQERNHTGPCSGFL